MEDTYRPEKDMTAELNDPAGQTVDNDELKRTEEALRSSERFVRSILDTVDEGFIVIDPDYRILTANRAYCSQVHASAGDVIGKHCFEISHRIDRPCYEAGEECAVRHVFETGEPRAVVHRHPDGFGSILYVETKAFPIKDDSGAVESVIEIVNNITEKHLLQEEQLKTQKLEAIGTLAGGIAHDFNNLLQGIFGYISMTRMSIDQKEKALAMLGQSEEALQLAVNLTSQLLTFSKGGKPVKKKIQLRLIIENSVRFALSGSRADYRIDIDDQLWSVEADEGQLSQVIQNIVLNADQAMPAGGSITITARNLHARGRKGLFTGIPEGDCVEICIQDRGPGIPAQHLPRIFDPYFTTKEKGSGLGLATSYSIIRNHGGMLDVTSDPGKGSTFSICLPAVKTAAAEAPAASEAARQKTKKGKILVMDDEELIREITRELIKALGHEVAVAAEGEDALEKYRSALGSDSPFDIVILDLTIRGGLGGAETIGRLLETDPGVKAIVSSGYTDAAILSDFRAHGFRARLEKPYKLEELRNTLNALLSD
ncbi:MAG: response regulator [Nitrospirae bacterium]|nr:MAG: response regulator [Nitrospirota bacterium]